MTVEHDRDLDTQTLSRLQEIWEDATGLDPEDLLLQPDTTLAEMMQAYTGNPLFSWFREELNFADLFYRIEKEFGFSARTDEWIELFGGPWEKVQEDEWNRFQHEWTVQRLIDLIRVRLAVVSFDPVNICGKDCGPAGAFFAIQDVARSACNEERHFGPSSLIQESMTRAHLEKFWNQLQFTTRETLPQIRTGCSWGITLLFVAFLGVCLTWKSPWLHPGVLFLLGLFCFALLLTRIDDQAVDEFVFSTRLPPEFQTFRDLAEYIANHKTTA